MPDGAGECAVEPDVGLGGSWSRVVCCGLAAFLFAPLLVACGLLGAFVLEVLVVASASWVRDLALARQFGSLTEEAAGVLRRGM